MQQKMFIITTEDLRVTEVGKPLACGGINEAAAIKLYNEPKC